MPASCPQCEIVLTAREAASKSCPSCKAKIGSTALTSAQPSPTATPRSSRNRTPAGNLGRCDVSGKHASDTRRRYLQLVKVTPGVNSVKVNGVFVEVSCSDQTFRAGQMVMWKTLLVGFFWLILAVGGVALLAVADQAGVPESVMKAVALTLFLALPACVIGGLIFAPILRRRWLNRLIAEPLNSTLKAIRGCRNWGFRNSVVFCKKLPRGKTALPVSLIQSLALASIKP